MEKLIKFLVGFSLITITAAGLTMLGACSVAVVDCVRKELKREPKEDKEEPEECDQPCPNKKRRYFLIKKASSTVPPTPPKSKSP
jgi:hypothetical protein